ncbi:hypothetical protein AKJ39_02560 [candidate division MSBL1 archaeon SCGC-AAA259J03]|uniref:Amidohydrolase-related domain-containing protein n=1 Tax=candidate division MSBL1 archaeon SCGC-AAA259J03 TaxID=1698269 RepID=A0A656YW34_9EURY|nr:hypothetical protein AKJ39_02560 [candidate division MSBL1 archaeon SCGC-AAA259J03]
MEKLGKKFAFTGATLIDGTGASPLEEATIVVKNGRISEIGNKETVNLEDDIKEINISGHYLTPGLIDTHLHLMGITGTNAIDWVNEANYLQAIRTADEARKLLEFGFTTVGSGGSLYDFYLKKAIEEGKVLGPRLMASGRGLTRFPNLDVRRDVYQISTAEIKEKYPMKYPCSGVEEFRKMTREFIGRGADIIKTYTTGAGFWEKDDKNDVHINMNELKTVVKEAHACSVKVAVHCQNLQGIKMAVRADADILIHFDHIHMGEDVTIDEEICEKIANKNIIVAPTISINFVERWTEEEIPENQIDSWKLALEKGVKFAVGSDAFSDSLTPFGEYNANEIKYLVDKIGLSPLEAITSATKTGAEALGINDKIGTIEEGKIADLLVLKKDPTENIDVLLDKQNIKYTVKEGELKIEHSD